ncbi:MAG TPA: histidine kinase [Streptosporangiaceae bacterium]|nr:histidine kinase [Streptosporangiaceae bacterium]
MRATLSSLLVTHTPPSAALNVPSPGVIGLRVSSWWFSLLLASVAVLAIVLLRRRPFTALALLLAGSVTVAVARDIWSGAAQAVAVDAPMLLVVPVLLSAAAVSFIAATRPRPVSAAAAAVALGVQVGSWAASPIEYMTWGTVTRDGFAQAARPGRELFLGILPELAVALITIVAWLIGHSIRQAHLHSEALRAQADAQAATAERLRIARDLHDMVAHSVGIIAIQAGMGRRVIDTQPTEARDALAAIEATSRETLAGLRSTVGALRQAGPRTDADTDPLATPGLADLARLVARTRDAGVRVDVRWHGQPRPLSAEADTCAFRIIQEAVTNVVRHAGTGRCQVSVDHRAQDLCIEVTDDGPGAATAGTGYGIAGMRERAALLHGELTAGPRPEGGFRVTARLPLPAAAARPSAAADQLPVPAAH